MKIDNNRLKVILAEKGITNKQLAEILDKYPVDISKWVANVAQSYPIGQGIS